MATFCFGQSVMWGQYFLRKRRFAKPKVAKQFLPPECIRGRAGCFLIAGSLRVAPGFVYLPPHPLRARERKDYIRTVRIILDFVMEVIAGLPTGTMPIFFCDLNTGVGKNDDGAMDGDDMCIGMAHNDEENEAGTLLRALLRDTGLCVADSFFEAGRLSGTPKVVKANAWTTCCFRATRWRTSYRAALWSAAVFDCN